MHLLARGLTARETMASNVQSKLANNMDIDGLLCRFSIVTVRALTNSPLRIISICRTRYRIKKKTTIAAESIFLLLL